MISCRDLESGLEVFLGASTTAIRSPSTRTPCYVLESESPQVGCVWIFHVAVDDPRRNDSKRVAEGPVETLARDRLSIWSSRRFRCFISGVDAELADCCRSMVR